MFWKYSKINTLEYSGNKTSILWKKSSFTSDSVFNYFRAKLKTTRKTKEDKEHVVAEEVKQDPAPEEMLNEEEVKQDPAAEEMLNEEVEQETTGAFWWT